MILKLFDLQEKIFFQAKAERNNIYIYVNNLAIIIKNQKFNMKMPYKFKVIINLN